MKYLHLAILKPILPFRNDKLALVRNRTPVRDDRSFLIAHKQRARAAGRVQRRVNGQHIRHWPPLQDPTTHARSIWPLQAVAQPFPCGSDETESY